MKMPEQKGSVVRCDCCRDKLFLREALYDCDLHDFVCGECALDLNAGAWALLDSGFLECLNEASPPNGRGRYEGWNL